VRTQLKDEAMKPRAPEGGEMLYHDNEARSLLAREHAELLASEMRRVRMLMPDQDGYPTWTRLAAALLGRTERLRRRKRHSAPAYDA
jgi:hypothetical protein